MLQVGIRDFFERAFDSVVEQMVEVQAAVRKCKIEHFLSPLLQVTPGELTIRRCLILSHYLPRFLGPGVAATQTSRWSSKALQ